MEIAGGTPHLESRSDQQRRGNTFEAALGTPFSQENVSRGHPNRGGVGHATSPSPILAALSFASVVQISLPLRPLRPCREATHPESVLACGEFRSRVFVCIGVHSWFLSISLQFNPVCFPDQNTRQTHGIFCANTPAKPGENTKTHGKIFPRLLRVLFQPSTPQFAKRTFQQGPHSRGGRGTPKH